MLRKLLWFLLSLLMGATGFAQIPVSPDKQFWKKRIVRRIDLQEKINRPLVHHESSYYDKDRFTQRNGLVAAIFSGLIDAQYEAYDPENWDIRYDYPSLVKRMKAFEDALENQQPGIDDFFGDYTEVERLREEFNGIMEILEEDPHKTAEEWGGFRYVEANPSIDALNDSSINFQSPYAREVVNYQIDYSQYEESIHLVEDWIFNMERSAMQQNIDYFEIIWTDPTGMLPEKVLARFKWADVVDILDKTQWKNRFNDAEIRSIKEVFELRIFHGYAIDIGGEPIKSLPEAAKREQEIFEFEHNLWSY